MIHGQEMQFVEIELDPGESTIAEAGSMMFKDPSVRMDTVFGDGAQETTGFFGKLSLWLADDNGDFVIFRDGTASMVFDRAQFEEGHLPSSHISTSGGSASRSAESLSIAAGDWPYSATAMSGVLTGAGLGIVGGGYNFVREALAAMRQAEQRRKTSVDERDD